MRNNATARMVSYEDSLRLDETLEFMQVIWAMDHALKMMSKHMQASIGVTGQQRLVIRLLGHFEKLSAGDLATTLHIHPSTVTDIVRRLERRRLIRRQPDLEDGRRTILTLTEQGKRLNASAESTIEGSVRRVLSRLSPQHIASARATLQLLAEELSPKRPRRRRSRQPATAARAELRPAGNGSTR